MFLENYVIYLHNSVLTNTVFFEKFVIYLHTMYLLILLSEMLQYECCDYVHSVLLFCHWSWDILWENQNTFYSRRPTRCATLWIVCMPCNDGIINRHCPIPGCVGLTYILVLHHCSKCNESIFLSNFRFSALSWGTQNFRWNPKTIWE